MNSRIGDSIAEFGCSLKEWATITRALEEGLTAVLLRKGGLREKGFGVPCPRFLLFPTYIHQEKKKFRPEFHKLFEKTKKENPGPEKLVISSIAEVVYSAKTNDRSKLPQLSALTPMTEEELENRYQWKADQALQVLVVRTSRLEKPLELEMKKEFGGCVSWVEVGPQDISVLPPSQSEEDLKQIRVQIQEILNP